MSIFDFPEPLAFEWDKGNKERIWGKHKISAEECEEAIRVDKIFIQPDGAHSSKEMRFICISQTKDFKFLFIVFTIRNNLVRIISARNMHKKEQQFYEKKINLTKI